MCTLTWLAQQGGYFVAFSRDERRSRAPGIGPRIFDRERVSAIAPIDGDAGGTWIAVNELGMTLALLNGYRFQVVNGLSADETDDWKSRGELPLLVCDVARVGEVGERLSGLALGRYRPFELVAFDAAGGARVASWTGTALLQRALQESDRPLISSSFDDAGARAQRSVEFARLAGSSANEHDLERFHASHGPSRGAYSPCMHREDAQTVSFTRVRVGSQQVELSYQPQSPCALMPSVQVGIPRRVVARS